MSSGASPPGGIDTGFCVEQTWIDAAHYFPEVGSTNSAALNWALQNGDPSSQLFVAGIQTRGRGRGANRWWSAPGALTFSVLTAPLAIGDERAPLVSLTVGATLCRALEPLVPSTGVRLKWPNDVFLGGKKACGVLIEMTPVRPKRLVIGVGINVNNSIKEAPEDFRARATSLADAAGAGQPGAFDLTDVLIRCLREIGDGIDRLVAHDPALPDLWRAYSLLTGKWVRIELPNREISGRCETIADDGALMVATDSGTVACFGGVVAEFR